MSNTARHRGRAAFIAALAACALLGLAAGLRGDAEAPASAPASQPSPVPRELDGSTDYHGQDLTIHPDYWDDEEYARPAEFDQPEWLVLMDKVYDGVTGLNSDGLSILLRKVAALKDDDPAIIDVNRANLMEKPKKYRGRKVRLEIQFLKENRLPSPVPSQAQALYVYTVTARTGKDREAVLLYSDRQIPNVHKGDLLSAVGYFYCVQRSRTEDHASTIDTPLLIIGSLERTSLGSNGWSPSIMMGGIVVALLVVYILVRYKMSNRRPVARYRPRRDDMTDSDIEASRRMVPPELLAKPESPPSDTETPPK
ncbi:MAG: hypothetical protein BIFFINMI_00433 [Phycisphaerae bacterium]|nr:hypothetical protein [Phycisphaerae bacterium]